MLINKNKHMNTNKIEWRRQSFLLYFILLSTKLVDKVPDVFTISYSHVKPIYWKYDLRMCNYLHLNTHQFQRFYGTQSHPYYDSTCNFFLKDFSQLIFYIHTIIYLVSIFALYCTRFYIIYIHTRTNYVKLKLLVHFYF